MSRWRRVVRRELGRYREQTGHDVLERGEFLDAALPVLRREFPENRTPGQKFSQVMQQLRDREEVEFVDGRGTYRILSLSGDVAAAGPDAPAYAVEEYDPLSGRAADEYETTAAARSISAAFRDGILNRYDHTCPVSGVDHDALLDVAHVLPWSAFPERRTDPGNVLPLDRTHHAGFDAGLFTIDADHRLRVAPSFETDSDLLRRTLVERDGEPVRLPADAPLDTGYLDRHNRTLDWWPA